MSCGVIYKKEVDHYKYLDIITGEKRIIKEQITVRNCNEYYFRHLEFINNKLPDYDSKYFLIRYLGKGKCMYIDSDGELQVGTLNEGDLKHISNDLYERAYTNSKSKYKVDGRQIYFSDYANSYKIMVCLIALYNSKYTKKVPNKYNGKLIEHSECNTIVLPSHSYKANVIHCIGESLYNITYNTQSDCYVSEEVDNLSYTFINSVHYSRRKLIPLARSVTDNIYYTMLDTNFANRNYSLKSSIVKVTLQEIMKNLQENRYTIESPRNNDRQIPAYSHTQVDGNKITLRGLDGKYEYDMDKVNKEFGVELIKDMRSVTLSLIGKPSDYVVMTNDKLLLRLEPTNNNMFVPVECASIAKDSLCIDNSVKQISIPNSVVKIATGFISSTDRQIECKIEIDNNEQLEVINVFRTMKRYNSIEVTFKNKIDKYTDIEYYIHSTKDCTVLSKLNKDEIRRFLYVYSKSEFDSFKGLDNKEEFRSLLVKWRNNRIYKLYDLCDIEGKEFIRTYIEHIDKRVLMCYNRYIKNTSE